MLRKDPLTIQVLMKRNREEDAADLIAQLKRPDRKKKIEKTDNQNQNPLDSFLFSKIVGL